MGHIGVELTAPLTQLVLIAGKLVKLRTRVKALLKGDSSADPLVLGRYARELISASSERKRLCAYSALSLLNVQLRLVARSQPDARPKVAGRHFGHENVSEASNQYTRLKDKIVTHAI